MDVLEIIKIQVLEMLQLGTIGKVFEKKNGFWKLYVDPVAIVNILEEKNNPLTMTDILE